MPVKNIHGNGAHEGVQLGDRVVVVLAGERDLVLGLGQLLLEVEEVGVGLEVRVGLGDGVQPDQGALELGVRGRLGRDVAAGRGRLDLGARLGDLLEDLALVGGVPLDRVHQVRDQVGTAGELDVDATERLLGRHVVGPELVEPGDAEGDEGEHDDAADDESGHGRIPCSD